MKRVVLALAAWTVVALLFGGHSQFARIHRSAIVNLQRVRELAPRAHGDCEVVLRGGARLPVSRTRAARLRALRH